MKHLDVEKIEKDVEKIEKEKEQNKEKYTEDKKSGFLPYLLGLGLGLILSFGAMYLLAGKEIKEEPAKEIGASEQNNLPTTSTEETNTESQSKSTQNNETPTPPTPETTTTNTKEETQSTLDKSKITIQLLNGNGITGDAAKVKTILEKDGWKVAAYGNANSFNYKNTYVYYKKGNEEAAKGVADTLKNAGRHTAILESPNLSKYDIQIVLGKQ